jgi:hypothetical protein
MLVDCPDSYANLLRVTSLLLAFILLVQGNTGTVSGTVQRVTAGAAGVRVSLLPVPAEDVALSSQPLVSIGTTDFAGNYRLENVPPGRYYILAGPVDAPTYYPGVVDIERARIVSVPAAASLVGMDFAFTSPPTMKVSGRVLPGTVDPRWFKALRLTISRTVAGRVIQLAEARTKPDGSFEFPSVVHGTYELRSDNGRIPPMSVAVTGRDITGIELGPMYSGPGVKVSGRLRGTIRLSDTEPAAVLISGRPTSMPTSITLETPLRPDGSFEFRNVPPGTYSVQTWAAAGMVFTVKVGSTNVDGIEFPTRVVLGLSGKIVMDDGSPAPRLNPVAVQKRPIHGGSGSDGGWVFFDSTFRSFFNEGDYQYYLRMMPAGFATKSITMGSLDILRNPLKVTDLTKPEEIVMTLTRTGSAAGFKVRGRVIGPIVQRVPSTPVRIGLQGGSMPPSLILSPDGSFEFPSVVPGVYMAEVSGSSTSIPARWVEVVDRDVTNLDLTVSPSQTVTGLVTFLDSTGAPFVPPADDTFMFMFVRQEGSNVGIRAEGAFSLTLPVGEHGLLFNRFHTNYVLKSATSGSADLLRDPLRIDATTPAPIQITIQKR